MQTADYAVVVSERRAQRQQWLFGKTDLTSLLFGRTFDNARHYITDGRNNGILKGEFGMFFPRHEKIMEGIDNNENVTPTVRS